MSAERVIIERADGHLATRTEILVVPGTTAESRRVTVSNSSDVEARVELTSYQEVVLATPLSDRGHRAFSNLFVQTEWLADNGTILAMRRQRSKEVKPSWGGHTIAVESRPGGISCETDRTRFIGRGRTARNPVAMGTPGDLSGAVGAVLDPVFALRTTLTVPAGGAAQVIFSTFAAADREEAVRLAELFGDWETAVRSFDEGEESEPGSDVSASDAAIYQDLAGLLLYGARSPGSVRDQSAESISTRPDLLAIGITGEWPIVLARVNSRDSIAQVVELLALHRYWRSKGIAADVLILCSVDENDPRLLDDMISLVQVSSDSDVDQPAGVFVKAAGSLRRQDIDLLDSIARIRINCGRDSLEEIARG